MRFESTFLRSAVARRVFWVLLAAAGLPLAMFATIGYHALATQVEAYGRARTQDAAKHAGLRIYDRLVAAQRAVAALAADGTDAARRAPVLAQLFASVAFVPHSGEPADAPDAALAATWRALTAGNSPAPKRSLWWLPAPRGGAEGRIFVGARTAGGWWIGEVASVYLWGELRDGGAAERTCVTDVRAAPLLCPSGPRRGANAVSWSLFMQGDFAAPDWVFTREPAATAALAAGELPLQRMAVLLAVLTLLLIGVLSMVLVRRSTAPLERLIEGTRRLAQRDWSARVQLDANDEFAQLAQAFNEMARRIGTQVEAMQVQSRIDREILSGLDLDRVLQQVVARLGVLAHSSHVAVLVAPPHGTRWRCYRAGAPVREVALDAESQRLLAADARLLGSAAASWLAGVLHDDAPSWRDVSTLAASFEGRLLGAMLYATAGTPDEDALASIAELRDRLAVTLGAAARERELRDRAERDALTGLLNRAGLGNQLDALLAAGEPLTLLYIDLDGFKEVNDSLGHPLGDELLCQVAALLVRTVPGAALVGRPGGDEFVVVVHGDGEAMPRLAAQLCRAIGSPWTIGGCSVRIGASIGLVASPANGRDRVELMRRADVAMYGAKAAGRGRHAWYDRALDERAAERAWLERELRGALERGELLLYYQPRLATHGDAAVSVEALLRWRHPQRGFIGPQQFIPVAEECGLIEPLGRWVVHEACRQLAAWRADGIAVVRLAINVSARQLETSTFVDDTLATLAAHGLFGADIEVELTESVFVGDADAVTARLEPLRRAGVLIALDDFGTGFSSLSSLYRLPVDVLKVDRSFVMDLGRRDAADAVTRSIVALARALGKLVVAEGVETAEQARRLRELGCDELQGYLFARPLPAEALVCWLAREPAVPVG